MHLTLFNFGDVQLHSGKRSNFKIDCDDLTQDDLNSIAALVAPQLPPFSKCVGIPFGGTRLAVAFGKYAQGEAFPTLIVDDVLTSGSSMLEYKNLIIVPPIGFVIFSRTSLNTPELDWIKCLFQAPEFL